MDAERRRSAGTRALFVVVLVVLGYVVLSIAIAINTVDKCGEEDAPKHWSLSPGDDSWQLIPPEWICEEREAVF